MLKVTLACLVAAVLLSAEIYGQTLTSCPNGLILNFAQTVCVARFRVSSSGPELESTGPWEATVALEEGTITGEVTIELTLISPLGMGIMPTFVSLTFAQGTTGPSTQVVPFTVPNDNIPGGDSIFNVQAIILQPGLGLFDLDDVTSPTDVGQAIDSVVFTVINDDCPPNVTPIPPTTATGTIVDDDGFTIGFVPPPGEPPFVGGVPSYCAPEDGGPALVYASIISGSIEFPRQVQISFFTSEVNPVCAQGGFASFPDDYGNITSMVLTFNSVVDTIQVNISIFDDNLCDPDENFQVNLATADPDVNLNPATGFVAIKNNDFLQIVTDMHNYTVNEFDQGLWFNITIIRNEGVLPSGQSCIIPTSTEDHSAISGEDYVLLSNHTGTITSFTITIPCHIYILDDFECEEDEQFYITLTVAPGSENCCEIPELFRQIQVTIIDDDECVMGVGDDPHFSIGIAEGKMLCYTVQGEHGFAFNLISNEKVYMNAMFVPDSRRAEVTWLGSMGIIVQSSGYQMSNATAMRFEVLNNKIYINDKIELEAGNIEKLTFSNGKLTISEAPPAEGFKFPKVYVDLRDIELSFSIAFVNEHLDLYWHSTGQKTADSHGLIGQFFRKGIELDEVRKFLILPGKEPVPVMRRPIWSFMEREMPDDQLCWTAVNPGYQGQGLIDGTYFDYVVNDVLTTDFTFKKQN